MAPGRADDTTQAAWEQVSQMLRLLDQRCSEFSLSGTAASGQRAKRAGEQRVAKRPQAIQHPHASLGVSGSARIHYDHVGLGVVSEMPQEEVDKVVGPPPAKPSGTVLSR